MEIGDRNTLVDPARFFSVPSSPRQRQYEALRAFYVDEMSSAEAARAFGYTVGAFQVLCHRFRHQPGARVFFVPTSVGRPPGVRSHDAVREEVIALRKKNYSVQDISRHFKERGDKLKVTPAAARDILREEGFAPLPRRLDGRPHWNRASRARLRAGPKPHPRTLLASPRGPARAPEEHRAAP